MGDEDLDGSTVDDGSGAAGSDTDAAAVQDDMLAGAAPDAPAGGADAVAVAPMDDGRVMTIPTWGGEEAHIWHEGTNLTGPGARIVGDEQGNMVAWNPETGEVTTAIKDQNQPPGTSAYSVSRDLPSFDE